MQEKQDFQRFPHKIYNATLQLPCTKDEYKRMHCDAGLMNMCFADYSLNVYMSGHMAYDITNLLFVVFCAS